MSGHKLNANVSEYFALWLCAIGGSQCSDIGHALQPLLPSGAANVALKNRGSRKLFIRPRKSVRPLRWSSKPHISSNTVEHWRAETEGLRFDSSWRLSIFFLCLTLVTRRKNVFLYFPSYHNFHPQSTHALIFLYDLKILKCLNVKFLRRSVSLMD